MVCLDKELRALTYRGIVRILFQSTGFARAVTWLETAVWGGKVQATNRKVAAGVRASGFRLWSGPGLASESAAEALPRLEEAEAAGQAGNDSEKAGPGLSTRCSPSPPGSHSLSPTQPGSWEPRDPGVVLARLARTWLASERK